MLVVTRIFNFKILNKKYTDFTTKWLYLNCYRTKSSAEPKTKTYSHTILFPKTDFPVRSTAAIKNEIQEKAQFAQLYNWQREHLKGPEFILHDGPPYANGDLHMGHAVNKIIKDVNNRSQVLQGNKVHYVPGWDCHGLPIELKALQKAKSSDKVTSDKVQIRNIARSFALETVDRQKEAFKSWGVMADWDNQCYLTLSKVYVQRQLRLFYKMYSSGFIYRALKPVYWSPSSRTALAEAELEYDPNFKSKEVYVSFPFERIPDVIKNEVSDTPISAIIWTTTPWTLVANKAICFSPQLQYSVVTLAGRRGLFVVATSLVETLEKIFGVTIGKIFEFDGSHLSSSTYTNNLTNETLPLLPGDHVTAGKGTGLVHTAPAHGPDDFKVGLKNNIPVKCNVSESGCYEGLDPSLEGLPVLSEGQEEVIRRLGDSLLHQGTYIHAYPLDWRTKKPVIIRASEQWFINTEALKEKALSAVDELTILPQSTNSSSRSAFRSLLSARPYWCVSRQRAWGTPIPAINVAGNTILDGRVIENLCLLIETKGPDAWWTCDVTDLLTDDVIKDHRLEGKEVTKGNDIMDIWLDSGLSWQTLEGKASLYSEGVDQLTGWFQASLLTALALKGDAPYKSIFVHGFVVDDKKRKMSKSIGNIIEPATIINGGKDKRNQPAYGVDTLRWWVASHATQHSQIVINKKFLDDCQSEVIRIRNIFKYLLGVIGDLEKTDFEKTPKLNYFDDYMVKECHDFSRQINDHYNSFGYNHVAQTILYFISNKVSALYCHCVKDRLYCSEKKSAERLSAQLVLNTVLVTLFKAVAPILPHLVEESWQYHPLFDKPFYFTENIPVLDDGNTDVAIIDTVLEIKKDICSVVKNDSLKKFSAVINVNEDLFDKLGELNTENGFNDSVLCEILELASVGLVKSDNINDKWTLEVNVSEKEQCLRCRKYNAVDNNDKCARCESVLETL